jgi:hypothetical protein
MFLIMIQIIERGEVFPKTDKNHFNELGRANDT